MILDVTWGRIDENTMANFFSRLTKNNADAIVAPAKKNTAWVDERDARIIYRLRPRAQRISIKIDTAKREITVAVPKHSKRLQAAQNFVEQKWDWVQVQLETLPRAQPFIDGGSILFQGEMYTLHCPKKSGRAWVDHEARAINVPASPDTFEGRAKRFLIRQAREALANCSHVHAGALGKKIESISVRDTSSRWGSCKKGSPLKGGTISYSWRLVCAPPYVLDYVCAHECAHLVEANHGKGFWALCDELVDTVKPAKQWLNKNGHLLHAVGANA